MSIEDRKGLHEAIAFGVIEVPRPLSGAEFRFLRLEMNISQRRLGELIGADEQAVRRWEKARSKPVNGTAERMLRVLYLSNTKGDGDIRRMIDRVAELDCQPMQAKVVYRETSRGWEHANESSRSFG